MAPITVVNHIGNHIGLSAPQGIISNSPWYFFFLSNFHLRNFLFPRFHLRLFLFIVAKNLFFMNLTNLFLNSFVVLLGFFCLLFYGVFSFPNPSDNQIHSLIMSCGGMGKYFLVFILSLQFIIIFEAHYVTRRQKSSFLSHVCHTF